MAGLVRGKSSFFLSLYLLTLVFSNVAQTKTVSFENSAYSIGDLYNESNQEKDWDVIWSTGIANGNVELSSNAKVSGSRSLKVSYPANRVDPKQAVWRISSGKTNYLSYKLLFAENFDFNGQGGLDGGKLPGLAGAAADDEYTLCGNKAPCGSGSGFTARLMWETDGLGKLYLYDVSKGEEGIEFGKDVLFSPPRNFKRGAWQTVTQRVTVNDPGQSNGVIQVWLDGEMVVDVTNRKIVNEGEMVDRLYFSTFFGGGSRKWTPSSTQTSFFDDFVVSDNPSDVGL